MRERIRTVEFRRRVCDVTEDHGFDASSTCCVGDAASEVATELGLDEQVVGQDLTGELWTSLCKENIS